MSDTITVVSEGDEITLEVSDIGDNYTIEIVETIGLPGPAGEGVPIGGTTGQVLAKASNTDYDTEWVTGGGGGGGSGDVVGPASAVNNNFSAFDGTTGKLIKDSGYDATDFEAANPNIQAHIASTSNPHSVTKSQVGLSNVDNTSDANKPVSTTQQTAIDAKVSDTAYDATSWNGVTTIAPSKNAVRDEVETLISDIALKAPLASPALTGTPTAPTQAAADNSTKIATTAYVDTAVASGTIPDATTLIKGKIQLAGDLSGTAALPTVPGLAGKEPTITAGTTGEYWRGDKTFQTLDKTAVGLSNVDNTSDATKNAAAASLTNKTIDADLNNITNIENADIKSGAAIAVNKLAAVTSSRALVSDASGFVSPSSVTDTELGYVSGVTSSIQTQINSKQASDATLTALASYNTNGILTQTAADTFTGRTITGTASNIGVTNGDGVSGNPTIDLVDAGTTGTYGSASSIPVITTDTKGRVTGVTPTSVSITSSAVTNFFEAAQDAAGAALTDTSSIDFTYNDAGNTISAVVLPAGVDHDSLLNYSAARHKLHPVTTTDNTISRYDGTSGDLQGSNVTISDVDEVGSVNTLGIVGLGTYTGASTNDVGMVHLGSNQSWGFTSGTNYMKPAVQFSGTQTFTLDSFIFAAGFLFNATPTITNAVGANRNISSFYTTNANPTFLANTNTVTQFLQASFISQPAFTRSNSGAWNCSASTGFTSTLSIGAGCTVTTSTGFGVSSGSNLGIFTTQIGFSTAALTTATNNVNFLGGGSPLTGNYNMCQIDQYANRWNGAQGWKGRNISAATTLLATDHFISISGGGAFNLQLPLANANGSGFRQEIIVRNDGGGTVTMTLSGADGLTGTTTIATGTSKTYISNGTATWFHIATA